MQRLYGDNIMKTIWFCGNDEKTLITIAEFVGEELINRDKLVELIVESEIKEILGRGLKDTPEDKATFADRLGFLGNLLHRNNIFALVVSNNAALNDRKVVKESYKNYMQVEACPAEGEARQGRHGKPSGDPLCDLALDIKDDLKTNAKKIIELLIKERLIPEQAQEVYSKEEEEEIRRRLEDLGYV